MAEVRASTVRLNEGIQVQEVCSCPLCANEGVSIYQGLRDRLFGALGIWALMRCTECGLVYLNPRPIPEDIGKLYEKYYTHDFRDYTPKFAALRRRIRDSILATSLGYKELAKSFTTKVFGKIFSRISPVKEIVELGVMLLQGSKRGRLLDVGCGSGQFLARMQGLGWEVVGVEPDREAVRIAKERFGLTIHEGTLEEIRFPDNSFDAITMNHVIEHVYDPVGTFEECYRILKPEGKLVVITPNIASLGYKVFHEAWRGLEIPRHLYLFSPRTLSACVERAGFQILKLWTASRLAQGIWVASRLIKRNGKLPSGSPEKVGLQLKLEGLLFWMIEYPISRIWHMGEELVLESAK